MSTRTNHAQMASQIEDVVSQLGAIRIQSLENRHRGDRPPKLPSRKVLIDVLEGFGAALFPNRLGRPDLTDQGIDYYVGHTLDVALKALEEQIRRELLYVSGLDHLSDDDRLRAEVICQTFASRLPNIRRLLDTDIEAAFQGDPAARSIDEMLVCYPGITAITHYRIGHELYLLGVPLLARIISDIAHSITGVDIHPGAQIGGRFFIDHGTGVVIGETAIIGEHVRLYQAVTLGAKRFPTEADGSLVKGEPRHPIVENDVVIYAGATILGRITIGKGSTIGGNVWLTRSVPANSHVYQAHVLNEIVVSSHDTPGLHPSTMNNLVE